MMKKFLSNLLDTILECFEMEYRIFIVPVDQDCLLVFSCYFFLLQRVVVICRRLRSHYLFECLGFEFVCLVILLSGERERERRILKNLVVE